MNGGCSRFNESPRWSSTGSKESVRDKRSKRLQVAREVEKREKEKRRKKGRGKREKGKKKKER